MERALVSDSCCGGCLLSCLQRAGICTRDELEAEDGLATASVGGEAASVCRVCWSIGFGESASLGTTASASVVLATSSAASRLEGWLGRVGMLVPVGPADRNEAPEEGFGYAWFCCLQ